MPKDKTENVALERRLEEGELVIQADSLGKRTLSKVKSWYKGSNVGVYLGSLRKSKVGMWLQESEWGGGGGLRDRIESGHIEHFRPF